MGGAQPEAVFDAEARLPYSIVVTALQGETRRTLSDAQHRSLEAPWLPVMSCSFFFFYGRCNKTKWRSVCVVRTLQVFSVNCEDLKRCCCYVLFYWLGAVYLITDLL